MSEEFKQYKLPEPETDELDEGTLKDLLSGFGSGLDIAKALVPLGGVVAWAKSLSGTPQDLPSNYLECNGQTVSDPVSPFNGVTLPDLNGGNRFLRGNSTSGGTGGSSTVTLTVAQIPAHTHVMGSVTVNDGNVQDAIKSDAGGSVETQSAGGGEAHENKPPYYDIVWIMRVR